MTPVEAFKVYLSLKLTFEGKYDAAKYNYSVNVGDLAYYKRRDKFFFEKAARLYPKKQDLIDFYVAHLKHGVGWAGDMFENDDKLLEYSGNVMRLSYNFKEDMKRVVEASSSFADGFTSADPYPKAFELYLEGSVKLESLAVLHALMKFGDQEFDQILWPEYKHKVTALAKVLPIDKARSKKVLTEILADGYK